MTWIMGRSLYRHAWQEASGLRSGDQQSRSPVWLFLQGIYSQPTGKTRRKPAVSQRAPTKDQRESAIRPSNGPAPVVQAGNAIPRLRRFYRSVASDDERADQRDEILFGGAVFENFDHFVRPGDCVVKCRVIAISAKEQS
ncbi:MAG TPA: hypothetical protein VND87_00510 [Stellaceae bacterium]|nr:hypothetical protein [Stellaceae bacterium]